MINIATYLDLTINDCIEILFFSSIIYYFTLWLNKDRQKNLLIYFYGYCLIAFGAYYCSLSTISFFLFTGFPVITMLFILLHQETLQRNFVALHNMNTHISSAMQIPWYKILIRSCLVLLHKQKHIICVIEQCHSLKAFIETSFIFNTPLQDGLLELLVPTQKNLKKNSFIWLDSQGIIKSIEGTWIEHSTIIQKNNSLPSWQQEALLFTAKTDALIVSNNLEQGTFSFIAQGKCLEGLTADQVVRILYKYSQKFDANQRITPHANTQSPENNS